MFLIKITSNLLLLRKKNALIKKIFHNYIFLRTYDFKGNPKNSYHSIKNLSNKLNSCFRTK